MASPTGQIAPRTGTAEERQALTGTHLADLIRSAADAVVGETLGGIVTDWNPAAERLYGYRAEEIVGQRLTTLVPPERMVETEGILARARRGEQLADVETQHWTKAGRRIDVSLSVSPVWTEAGEIIATSAIVRDITGRRAAEASFAQLTEELRASEAKYRTLVEQLPGAVYLLANDEQQTPLYFSPHIEELTGEAPDEALAFRDVWLGLVHPEDRERVAAEDERHGEQTEVFRAEYRHRRKDGSYVWVRDECVPVYDDEGQIAAWQGVMLDITDRIQAIEAQARLAALVESAEDAVISSRVDGTITSWNRGAERLYGYESEEMVGQSFTRLLPDDLDDPSLERVHAAVSSGLSAAPFETTRLRRDGTTFAASVSLSPIRDHNGCVIGISSISRDITERKQAESALRAALNAAETANQAKSQFLSMMSHELRTPLQAVLGYAEVLLADPRSSLTAEQRADIDIIHQGGQRMLTLITQLLDFSRIEAGRLDLVAKPVNLAETLEQVRQDVALQAMQKGLELRIDVPPATPLGLGDPERLRQVLLNLVGNAVKFTEQGSVHITAETTADGVAVAVRDTGIGIAPEALLPIFEAFHQVDSRLARRHGGAGLGLAIAQKLAELMNGCISVESAVGEGSTFTLHLAAVPLTQT